jgi:hypothetical protein
VVAKTEPDLSTTSPFSCISHWVSPYACRNGLMVQPFNSETLVSMIHIADKSVKKLISSFVRRKDTLGFKWFSYWINLSNFQTYLLTNS